MGQVEPENNLQYIKKQPSDFQLFWHNQSLRQMFEDNYMHMII